MQRLCAARRKLAVEKGTDLCGADVEQLRQGTDVVPVAGEGRLQGIEVRGQYAVDDLDRYLSRPAARRERAACQDGTTLDPCVGLSDWNAAAALRWHGAGGRTRGSQSLRPGRPKMT